MTKTINLDDIYFITDDIVAREIEGELIIIPLVAGVGDLEDDLYTLNDTGKEIWRNLNGESSLRKIVEQLCDQFNSDKETIGKDVLGLIAELEKRRMVRKKS